MSYTVSAAVTAYQAGQLTAPVDIVDSYVNVYDELGTLGAIAAAGHIGAITVTDVMGSLNLSAGDWAQEGAAIQRITNNFSLSVYGLDAATAAAIDIQGQHLYVTVTDSAANVAAHLDGLEALQQKYDYSGGITFTDAGTPTLSLSAAQMGGDLGVLAQISGNFHVSITDGGTVVVPQSEIYAFLGLQQKGELPTGYHLQFTGLDLPWSEGFAAGSVLGKPLGALPAGAVFDFAFPSENSYQMIPEFASLQSMIAAGDVVSITLSDDYISSISASQYFTYQAAIDSVTNSAVFNVTGVSVAQASAVAADSRIAKIAVADSSANILADLAGLDALAKAGALDSVGTFILLTSAQAVANPDLVGALNRGAGFWISDTAAGISANFDAIAGLQISHIQITDQNPLRITSSQLVPDRANFYNLPYASIAFTDAGSPTIAMTDNDAQYLFTGGTLARITTPYQIAVTDSAAPLFSIKASDYTSSVSVLNHVQGFTLALSGVTVADADSALAQAHVVKIEVSDTAANIVTDLPALETLIVAGKIDQVTQSDMAPITLGIAQLGTDAPFLAHFKSDADYSGNAIYDLVGSAADLSSNLDSLTKLTRIGSITLSDGGTAAVTMASSQWQQDQYLLSYISGPYTVAFTDAGPVALTVPYTSYYYGHADGVYDHIAGTFSLSVTGLSMSEAVSVAADPHVRSVSILDDASTLSANFSELQTLVLGGKLGVIDFESAPSGGFQVTTTQAEYGQAVFDHLDGPYAIEQVPVAGGTTIRGVASATGNSVGYSLPAVDYAVAGTGNGDVSVTNNVTHQTDQLSDIQQLRFADSTVFLTQAPSTSGTTTGNIAALYAAVLGREPDLPGLAFYQQTLQANPGISIQQFALYFLNSPEYTSHHSYAQSSAGDAQFITDTYQNLLDRAPEAGAVDWYQANVIAPYLTGLTPGTTAYAAAQTAAHAAMLVYFSASPEFLGDVQVTARHPADYQHWLMVV